jgi:hypothetical protein
MCLIHIAGDGGGHDFKPQRGAAKTGIIRRLDLSPHPSGETVARVRVR